MNIPTPADELRALRLAINELRAAVVSLREDLADPDGSQRSERERVAREAADRAYDAETERLLAINKKRY